MTNRDRRKGRVKKVNTVRGPKVYNEYRKSTQYRDQSLDAGFEKTLRKHAFAKLVKLAGRLHGEDVSKHAFYSGKKTHRVFSASVFLRL